jgi:hypothetical protein
MRAERGEGIVRTEAFVSATVDGSDPRERLPPLDPGPDFWDTDQNVVETDNHRYSFGGRASL